MDKPAAILSFRINEDGMSLVLEATNVVDGLNPMLVFPIDKGGRTRINVGMGDLLIDPVHAGEDLRKLFRSVPGSEKASLKLPSCSQLRNGSASFMTFSEYQKKQRAFPKDAPLLEEWPELIPDIYNALIRQYRNGAFCQ